MENNFDSSLNEIGNGIAFSTSCELQWNQLNKYGFHIEKFITKTRTIKPFLLNLNNFLG